ALRAAVENVAAQRRALPVGAAVAGYEFVSVGGDKVALSALAVPNQTSLFIYNFMYAPALGQGACPMCCSMLDGLNGAAGEMQSANGLAIVARATPEELKAISQERGWNNLPLYSSDGQFARDFGGEDADGGQWPMMHVFERDAENRENFRHFWSSELFYHKSDWPAHHRHIDMIWAKWNLLDMTRGGRG
ncbi:MAG: DUF899 family protein, partial [Pikeienuella sp.]